MKVLYLGHYKENSGWGVACRNIIEAMATTDLDVVSRAIRVSNDNPELSDVIKECENKTIRGNKFDVVIQNVLPHHMEYSSNFDQNIGYSMYEATGNFTSGWGSKLELMDKVWAPSRHSTISLRTMINNGNFPDFQVVGLPYDISLFDKQYEKIEHPAIDGNFIFYTIADLCKRKNISALIKAFHLAFPNNVPVSLLIKASKPGLNHIQTRQFVENICNEVKHGLKLYSSIDKYNNEVLITNRLDIDALMSVHETGHCFVSTSYGEGWSYPLYEAMGMGNLCIYPDNPSGVPSYDFIDGTIGIPVKSREVPTFGEVDTMPQLYTGRESWSEIDIMDLSQAMRFAYETYNSKDIEKMRNAGKIRAKEYSFESIGKIIKDKLCS